MSLDSSAVAPYKICTSSTRPASPKEGQLIFETDTNIRYYHDGTNWRLLGMQTIGYALLDSSSPTIGITIPTITNGLHLYVQTMIQSDTTSNDIGLQPNGDNISGNYFHQFLYGQNTTVTAAQSTMTGARMGLCDSGSTYWALGQAWVFNYAGSGQKTIQTIYGTPYGLSTSAIDLAEHCIWKSTAAITTLTLRASTGNFRAGSFMSAQVIGSV